MIFQKQIAFALAIAVIHFVVCGILGGIVFPASFGYALSDAYEPAAWWLVALDHLLLFLESPVAITLYWIYHPTPRFEPPHYFAVDFLDGSNFPVVLCLCALWSFGFGCLIALVKSRIRRVPMGRGA